MKKQQSGFTLIELVIVIVLLGLLAATAAPKFANIQDSAIRGNLMGAEGAMQSALGVAKAVNRTNTPTEAQIIAQFDGGSDFTSGADACSVSFAAATEYGAAGTAGSAVSIATTVGGTQYCVDMDYDSVNGVLTTDVL
jgi:MSHA pilin protein MshA